MSHCFASLARLPARSETCQGQRFDRRATKRLLNWDHAELLAIVVDKAHLGSESADWYAGRSAPADANQMDVGEWTRPA
jgi:hypothetical protein